MALCGPLCGPLTGCSQGGRLTPAICPKYSTRTTHIQSAPLFSTDVHRPGRAGGMQGVGEKKSGMPLAALWHAPCSTVACALQHCGMRLAALCHAPCSTVACALQSYFARSMTQMCMEHDTYALLSCDSSTGCRLVPRRAADPVEILDSDSPNSPSWLRPLTSPGLRAVGMLPAGLWHAPCRTILHGACHSPAWGMPHTVPHRCARSMPQVYSSTVCTVVWCLGGRLTPVNTLARTTLTAHLGSAPFLSADVP